MHKDTNICGTSQDGIFEQYENKIIGKPNLLGQCVLGINTRNTTRTATQLDEVDISDVVLFRCCKAGSRDFKKLIT